METLSMAWCPTYGLVDPSFPPSTHLTLSTPNHRAPAASVCACRAASRVQKAPAASLCACRAVSRAHRARRPVCVACLNAGVCFYRTFGTSSSHKELNPFVFYPQKSQLLKKQSHIFGNSLYVNFFHMFMFHLCGSSTESP